MSKNLTVEINFIKLARSLMDAQREASLSPSPKTRRKAEQLKSLFESKLATYEKQVAVMEQVSEGGAPFAKLI